jgi:hypothetical protein
LTHQYYTSLNFWHNKCFCLKYLVVVIVCIFFKRTKFPSRILIICMYRIHCHGIHPHCFTIVKAIVSRDVHHAKLKLYPLNNNFPFTPPSAPRKLENWYFTFCFSEFEYFIYMDVILYKVL